MKWTYTLIQIAGFSSVLAALLFLPPVTHAACRIEKDPTKYAACENKTSSFSLSPAEFAQCKPEDTAARGVTAGKPEPICCEYPSELNAFFSLKAALCGSSDERGPNNSTCWSCDDSGLRCSGLDFALGDTDPALTSSSNRLPIAPGDSTVQVWRVNPDAYKGKTSIRYNGIDYGIPSDLIMCTSDNRACGASNTQCSGKFEESTAGEKECTVVQTTDAVNDPDIRMGKRGWSTATQTSDKNLLTNIAGDNDRARGPQLSTIFGSVNTNPDITGLFQVNLNDGKTPIPIDTQGGGNFGATLIELATNPGGIIYAPVTDYDIGGGYNYLILYADLGELTLKATAEDNAAYGYTLHLAGFKVDQRIIAAYNNSLKDGRSTLAAIPCGIPIGTAPSGGVKTAIADTGTFMDPRVQKDWWNEPTATCNTGLGINQNFQTQTTQVCTVKAQPQATGVGRTAGAVDFCSGCTDNQGFIFTLLQKQIIELQGEVFPSGFKLEVPDLSFYIKWLGGAYPYFSPLDIQKKEKPIKSTYTVTSTANVSADSDEPKDTCYQQKQGVVTTNFPFLNKFLENALKLDAFQGPFGEQKDFNFAPRYPNQTLTDRDTRGCPGQTPGLIVPPAIQGSILTNIFSDIPEIAKPVLLAAVRISSLWGLISGGGRCKAGDANCSTGGGYDAQIYSHSLTPYGDRDIPDHIGVTKENEARGFTWSYKPYVARKTYAAAIIDNEFDHPGLFNPVPVNIPFPFAGTGGAMENLDDLRCMVTPLAKQTPDMKCGEVIDKAKTYVQAILSVPQNILLGVAQNTILGLDFLKSIDQKMITKQLSAAEKTTLTARLDELVKKYVDSGQWPNSQLKNTEYRKAIADFAATNGFNEAFLYSLWIEETHASSVGNYPFGCGGYRDFYASLNCLVTDPVAKTYLQVTDAAEALCRYADGHFPCTFETHPNFIRNLFSFYNYLTK